MIAVCDAISLPLDIRPPRTSVRRCQPWLGTFVEVWCEAGDASVASAAVAGAFASVARIQERMSFHSPESDVGRLNAEARRRSVAVDDATFEVLELALDLARDSGGLFDITVAPELVRWGLLPSPEFQRRPAARGTWRDILLMPRNQVRFLKHLWVDLGGIAKGYAVDCAVAAMRAAGAISGGVNAGGDLRVFGDRSERVVIRHPLDAGSAGHALDLHESALATSSACFTQRVHRGRPVNHFVDPRTRAAGRADRSVSIQAPRCAVADALTKVAMFSDAGLEPLLRHHHARAFLLDAGGGLQAGFAADAG